MQKRFFCLANRVRLLSNGGMQYWLGKLGAALKVPGKSHVKKDESLSSLFKVGLVDKLVDATRLFRLWVMNEHRYGLISTLRKCWTLREVRPRSPYQTKCQWGYRGDDWSERISLCTECNPRHYRVVSATGFTKQSRCRPCNRVGWSGLPPEKGFGQAAGKHPLGPVATLQSQTQPHGATFGPGRRSVR